MFALQFTLLTLQQHRHFRSEHNCHSTLADRSSCLEYKEEYKLNDTRERARKSRTERERERARKRHRDGWTEREQGERKALPACINCLDLMSRRAAVSM